MLGKLNKLSSFLFLNFGVLRKQHGLSLQALCHYPLMAFYPWKLFCHHQSCVFQQPYLLLLWKMQWIVKLPSNAMVTGFKSLLLRLFYFLFYLFYLPYLSSIHEKVNCIAILWTVSPHSLGSCLSRGVWVTCLPHKGGAFRSVPCPRTQQANLPACSPQPPINAERQAGKLQMPFFKVFWYDSTRGMSPRSTDC